MTQTDFLVFISKFTLLHQMMPINLLSMSVQKIIPFIFLALVSSQSCWGVDKISFWPTILFIKAQDLCQYQDAYGQSRSESMQKASQQIAGLISSGMDTQAAASILITLDDLVDKNRAMATAGKGMDVLLESSLKAYIDADTIGINPENTRITFANQGAIDQFLIALGENKRLEHFNSLDLLKVRGFIWGTYSYAPNCKGDLWVTIHIQLPKDESVSFQAQGKPEMVMQLIANQMVTHFQRTRFPTVIQMGDTTLVLVGAPGTSVNKAPNPKIAQNACSMIKARLPRLDEYDFLSILGNWSGGVSLGHNFWALSDNLVLSPDTRNPSPVSKHADVNYEEVTFYCVK